MTATVASMPQAVQQESPKVSGEQNSVTLSKGDLHEGPPPLPSLRASHTEVDKSKPLPTSLQSEFIPEEILSALTQLPSPSVKEKLGTPSKLKNGAVQKKGKAKGPSANLWHFPQQRKKFQHLTDQPVTLRGAGRDISFLYDVALVEAPLTKASTKDPSTARIKDKPKDEPMAVSDTLIPSEYHIVKSKGVHQLEYHDDKYTTKLVDDNKNLVKFPSLKPTSRFEVLQLGEALETMLDKSGIKDESAEVKGPTQMHNLLELIKKEQNIYNIVFHELIRQVTVECAERGELLARVRELYNQLLDKVPRQIKSLHQEVMAQRALDRRLTEELFRFKSSIAELTNELSDVREHDKVVTSQAQEAQDQLARALAESEKNSSLLNEYHELYELQRMRLESHIANLSTERDQWSNAAYSLALKVTEANSLSTARRLHVSEKAWCKLANHFTVVLSDKDTEQLTSLQGFIARHRELVNQFDEVLLAGDQKSHERLTRIRLGVEKWMEHFDRSVVASDRVCVDSAPTPEMIKALYQDMRDWQEALNKEVEKFGGDILLSREDSLEQVQKQVDSWTEVAIEIFNRHKPTDGTDDQNQEKLEEMIRLTKDLAKKCQQLSTQYQIRVNGENGTARGFINIQSSIESWDTKLNIILNGGPMPLEAEWARLFELFAEWIQSIEAVHAMIGTTEKEDDGSEKTAHQPMDKETVFQDSQKWMTNTVNGIDSQDSKLVEQVSVLHGSMVHWMIQVLLRIAPNPADSPQEIIDSCMSTALTYAQIREKASTIFDHLTLFSNYISSCCMNIVAEIVQRRQEEGADDYENEFRDLKKLKSECAEWIHTATILMEELKHVELAKMGGGPSTPYFKSPAVQEAAPVTDELSLEEAATPAASTEPRPGTPATGAPAPGTPAPGTTPQTPDVQPEPVDGNVSRTPDVELTSSRAPAADDVTPTEGELVEIKAVSSTSQEGDMSEMQVLGQDQNVWTQSLEQPTQPPKPSVAQSTVEGRRTPITPDTTRAYEALATVQTLQAQLLSSEERCQLAEERVATLEEELVKTQERLRELERKSATPDDAAPRPTPAEGNTTEAPQENEQKLASDASKLKNPTKASPTPPQGPKTQRASSQASVKSNASSRASSRAKKK